MLCVIQEARDTLPAHSHLSRGENIKFIIWNKRTPDRESADIYIVRALQNSHLKILTLADLTEGPRARRNFIEEQNSVELAPTSGGEADMTTAK